jgi:O-succinylbenzoate synthase
VGVNAIRGFTYRLPLTEPLMLAGQRIEWREGLLLCAIVDDQPRWSEAAPLPGFSRESLADVVQAARCHQWHRYPSLRWAYYALQCQPAAGRVAVSGLLLGSIADVRAQLDAAGRWPFRTVKLKVGRPGQLDEEVRLVRELCGALRPEQALRLDANRGWSFGDALTFARATGDLKIEYVEEPTCQPLDCQRLYEATGLRYALDESLRDGTPLDRLPDAAAYIVKPTLMGWPADSETTGRGDIPRVFSASFESGVGLWQIARLASAYAADTPVGLDTYRWLAQDVLARRLAWSDGWLSWDEELVVDTSGLRELDA